MSHPNRSDEIAWVFLEGKKIKNLIAGSKNKDSAFVFFRCRWILSTQITFKILILNPLSSSEEDIRRTVGTGGKFCYLEHSILSKISCAFKTGRGKFQQIARYCISSSCNHEEEWYRWYSTCSLRGRPLGPWLPCQDGVGAQVVWLLFSLFLYSGSFGVFIAVYFHPATHGSFGWQIELKSLPVSLFCGLG